MSDTRHDIAHRLAEQAWELQRDRERSAPLVDELLQEATLLGDKHLAAIARVIELTVAFNHGEGADLAREGAELESALGGEGEWLARIINLVALSRDRVGDYAGSLEGHRRALALFERVGSRSGTATALGNIGQTLQNIGEYAEALDYDFRALAKWEELGNARRIADALNNIGIVHKSMADYSKALEFYARSRTNYEAVGDLSGVGRVFSNMGIVYNAMGEFAKALEYYRRAIALAEQIGDERTLNLTRYNLGNVYAMLDDYAPALEQYELVVPYFEKTGNRIGTGHTLLALANIYNELGEFDRKLEAARDALAILEPLGKRESVTMALGAIGNELMRRDDLAGALEYLTRSLRIKEEIGDRKGIAAVLSTLGLLAITAGDLPSGLDHLRQSLQIQESIGDRPAAAHSMVRIGSALIESGEIAEGITMVEKGLDAAEALGKKKTVADAFKALVDAHERTGAYDKALRYLREHLRITAEIQSDETKRQLHQMEARKQIEIERLRNTELAGALAQLKAAQTQLVQSEKMASLGELTAGIAHEINNPINFVRANISPLRRDIDELRATLDAARQIMSPEQRRELQEVIDEREIDAVDAEIDALLDGIQEGARRTADIVAGLRSFSRLDEDELKPVDLHEGLDATINLLGSKLDGRIAISRSYSELPAVECYPGQINQVFMNIIGNAIDAIEAEGTIAIATTADDQTVNIAITDSGMGIAPEHLERIFEPFFTTKEIGKGTGLGLAIAYGIIRKHGGEITVTSAPNAGSTFTLTLPLSFAHSPQ